MEIEIIHRPSYSLAVTRLTPNERIRAEAGAMVSMSSSVNIETKAEGGILKSLGRAVLGGESFFQNFFLASAQGGEVTLAPELPGDMMLIELKGNKLMIQAGSYVASENGVELTAKVSVKAFMSAEGISMLEAIGHRQVAGFLLRRDLRAHDRQRRKIYRGYHPSRRVRRDHGRHTQNRRRDQVHAVQRRRPGRRVDRSRHDLHADSFTQGIDRLDHSAIAEAGNQKLIIVSHHGEY